MYCMINGNKSSFNCFAANVNLNFIVYEKKITNTLKAFL
jgi:hypothetical protein